ncbi:hypothetical protein PHMEG_00026618 [Phytophthora megakarya]|uniref:Retrotransposon gag domain-containing protein n=1 Tax=Phytophthora megakarya TaxID=4795 RepID=A0A225VAK6_9STRA|nr:hypothetical protein PHMEG_00026618 [Phytophthora megakarya]
MLLGAIQAATQDLYESLKFLVGEHAQTPDLNYQTGSSHYASATSEPDSDSPRAPQRMSLGPSGAKYLRSRANRPDQRSASPNRAPERPDRQEEGQIPAGRATPTTNSTGSSNRLDEYFQMAMNRSLKEQSLSVGTPAPHPWEYDPNDLGVPSSSGQNSGRATVATAAIGSGSSSPLIQRVRISAISDLKEFTGKDMDEDRARAWIGKVKSAFQRDQATEEEKCLTFADLMVGPAKNGHRQLCRTTKTKWADLLESFQTQYCNLGMSVAWQYYHARKRSEETPLDYLYRLNVAALRAKHKIKDGNQKVRREHIDHYIETLGDPELADGYDWLTSTNLRKLSRAGTSQEQATQIRVRVEISTEGPASAPAAPAHAMVRAIQAQDPRSGSMGSRDLTDPTRKVSCEGSSSPRQKRRGASQNSDPARSRTKASDGAGSPIVATRETEITKIETAVLMVGPGNTRIWIVGNVIQQIAVCIRVKDAGMSTKQENAP